MPQSVAEHWKQAQSCEAAGDFGAASLACERLLSIEANFVPAHLRLSRYAQRKNQYNEARRHALRAADAVRLGGGIRQIAYVTLRLLDFSEHSEIASTILSSDWKSPDVLQQSPSLAQHLWLAGRYEDALRFLDAVEPQLPPHALLRLTRGNVLRYLGRMEEAADCYESSLALSPQLSDAHWALATLTSSEPSRQWLLRLQDARKRAETANDALARAQLAYAAFHAHDRLGETRAAWLALDAGMGIMHARLVDKGSAQAVRLQALMDSQWLPETDALKEDGLPASVFIVGLPRTGTTLLDRILGNHGWVTSVGERNEFSAAAGEVSDSFFSTLVDAPPRAWTQPEADAVGRIYRQRLRALAPSTAVAVDKNPRNLSNLPLVLKALPEAKVLILRRERMDAAFSNLKELFQGNAYPYSYSFHDVASHVLAMESWSDFWAHAAPDRVKVVDYEKLVADPVIVIEDVLDFLGLPHREGLQDLERNASPVATASSAQVRGVIHARNIGAWRRYAPQLEPLRALLADRS